MRCKPTIAPPRTRVIHDMFDHARVHHDRCVESMHTRWSLQGHGHLAWSNDHPRKLEIHFADFDDVVMQVRHELGEHSHFIVHFDSTDLWAPCLLTSQMDGEDICPSVIIEPGVPHGMGSCPLPTSWPQPSINEFRIEGMQGTLVIHHVTIVDHGLPMFASHAHAIRSSMERPLFPSRSALLAAL